MSANSNLFQRVLFALVAIPLALALVWYGGFPLAFVLGATAVLGSRELFDLAARQGVRPVRPLGLLTAAALAPLVYGALVSPPIRSWLITSWPYLLAAWILTLLSWVLLVRTPTERPLSVAGVTLLAVA